MKVHLLYRDRDLDLQADSLPGEQDLIEDLGLDTLFAAMAQGDKFLYEVAQRAVLASLTSMGEIAYRQDAFEDCRRQEATIRELYELALDALDAQRKAHVWLIASDSPRSIMHQSVSVLTLLVEHMVRLHAIGAEHAERFDSEGFRTFFATIASELDDAYLEQVRDYLRRLSFKHGIPMSAELGAGNKGRNYVLRRPSGPKPGFRSRVVALAHRSGYSFRIADRDEAGARALEQLGGRGVNHAANATAQAVEHILSFFSMLRIELGFYIGALNAQALLAGKGEPTCRPVHAAAGASALSFDGLYDAGLSLRLANRVVGNDLDAGEKLLLVTGANQGGKSTFLRSIGLAQLMMQAGMFVAAESFSADIRDRVLTHFKREEDTTMTSGKFDEELARMRAIADRLTPRSLMLLNESFAATNEREGSEIGLQIVRSLLDSGVKVVLVTHMYDLAIRLLETQGGRATSLRAERKDDGNRTFRLVPREPLQTSYGIDVYRRIFAGEAAPAVGDPEPAASTG